MGDYLRYAVYVAPRPDRPLARFGANWLGWDAERGVDPAAPEPAGLPRPRAELVATPRRYGFHATMKAPFRLADGAAFADLDAAVRDLAAETPAFDAPLRIDDATGFVALVLARNEPRLAALADACVTRLDAFRAPPTPEEIAKREASGLTARQRAHLARWGYPYVLDAFVFHMTLTGALAPEDRRSTRAVLEAALAPILATPMRVEDLCVFGEAADGRFHLFRRHALAPRVTASPSA